LAAGLATVFCLIGMAGSAANASTVINFNSTPNGAFASYTESGVTFTAVSGGNLTSTIFGNTPNGTRGLAGATSPFSTIRAVIAGGASSVSIDLGDFAADADTIFLSAYDVSNVLLGTSSQLLPNTFAGMQTLTFSASGISYVIFGSTAPSGDGSSVYADNFTFDQTVAVPEPSTLLGGAIAGLGALAYRSRRRRSAIAS
jgi:hypothetical protein